MYLFVTSFTLQIAIVGRDYASHPIEWLEFPEEIERIMKKLFSIWL